MDSLYDGESPIFRLSRRSHEAACVHTFKWWAPSGNTEGLGGLLHGRQLASIHHRIVTVSHGLRSYSSRPPFRDHNATRCSGAACRQVSFFVRRYWADTRVGLSLSLFPFTLLCVWAKGIPRRVKTLRYARALVAQSTQSSTLLIGSAYYGGTIALRSKGLLPGPEVAWRCGEKQGALTLIL